MPLILTDKYDRLKLINPVRKDFNLLRCGLFYADAGLVNPVEVHNPENPEEIYHITLPDEVIEAKTYMVGLNVIVNVNYCSLDNVKRKRKKNP